MAEPAGHARLRVLVTNDDGIGAPALPILARHLSAAGHDVQVAAPSVEYTGCGASIGRMGANELIPLTEASLPGAPGVAAVAVAGPPALAVLAACLGLIGRRPDVVVSGTNSGFNTGPAVLHSGTLGAALTAVANGVPAIALSSERDAVHGYVSAAEFGTRHLAALMAALPAEATFNINVPDVPYPDLLGVRLTRLAERSLVAVTVTTEAGGLRLKRLRDERPREGDTDVGAIAARLVSITTIFGGVRDMAPRSLADRGLEELVGHA